MTAAVLDLDEAFDRDTVKLRGKEYELRKREEFSIIEWHGIVRMDAEATKLLKTAATSAETAKKLSEKQRQLANMLVVGGLPTDTPDWACGRIIHFWADQIDVGEKADGDAPPRKPRTTAASSRGSKRSTAASRKRGSTSPGGR